MVKVLTGVNPGQVSAAEAEVIAGAPTADLKERVPQASPSLDSLLEPASVDVSAPPVSADVAAGIDAGLAVEAEAQRQSTPTMAERAADEGLRPYAASDRWKPKNIVQTKPIKSNSSQAPDGNIRSRAKAMADRAQQGILFPSVAVGSRLAASALHKSGAPQVEVAAAIAEEIDGSLAAAVRRAGAVEESQVTGKQIPNALYMQIGSAVTENMIAELSSGDDAQVELEPGDVQIDELAKPRKAEEKNYQPRIAKAQGNARLGQMIHKEYMKMSGQQADKLPEQEAETLGDAFKEMWAANNPELVDRFVDPVTRQAYFQLTAPGVTALEFGAQERKRLFPKTNVRPAKTPLPGGKLPGEIGQEQKKASGRVGEVSFGNVIEEAVRNMATIPNVVDKQRAKILFATILPTLQSGDHNTWQAEINNFGPSKIKKYEAVKKDQERRRASGDEDAQAEEDYDPIATMAALTDKIAQEVRAVAMERNGANYLTYTIQAFNGRISPQQTFFDPTTSKAVRFVTRNAVPAIADPGSRVERNLREMYSLMLVGKKHTVKDSKGNVIDADALLPEYRELALKQATPKLYQWGKRLQEALTMTDAEYEAVAEAIEKGIALTDPNFPKFGGLDLDPNADGDLIAAIEDKGEDGPHFIDGLIDFYKYENARAAGRPYASYFNAYIDGKTNGLASNGMQMGHWQTARRTGVYRGNTKQLLDEGDIRDVLQVINVDSIKDGWDGTVDEFQSELNDVAEQVFKYRQLNKDTTMTFGYGKEIDSFGQNILDAINFLAEKLPEGDSFHQSLATLDQKMDREKLAGTLMTKYVPGLEQVLSKDALDTRQLMRGAAMLHSATNTLFSIKSYTGMDLNLGRNVSTGAEGATATGYRLYGEGGQKTVANPEVLHYEQEATSAAARNMDGVMIPGEYAYGGSLPGPVQSLDAATVAMSAAGNTWKRLKDASKGAPYMHTIYDAFKLDANGFDVMVEEINNNWLEASTRWSYLEQTLKSTKRALNEWNDKMRQRDPNDLISPNEALYMEHMLAMSPSMSGRLMPKFFMSKINKVKEFPNDDVFWKTVNALQDTMREVGYDMKNPPERPNVRQLRTFVQFLVSEINLRPRLEAMINKTNKNKKELIKLIKQSGPVYQYYAH